MVVYHIRRPSTFFFIVVSGGCCNGYLAVSAFVEEVDNSLILSMLEHVLTQ
jgi:hypothetical protein